MDPGQRVRSRSGPGPDLALMKKIKIYTFIEPSYGTTYNHLEKKLFSSVKLTGLALEPAVVGLCWLTLAVVGLR